MYDIKQGGSIAKFEKDSISFSAVAVEEEGSILVAAGFDGNIHVWSTEKEKYLGAIPAGIVVVS